MPVQLHFLGWDAPVTERVREFLLPAALGRMVDLEATFVIVPTRQAGRHLLEALARHCAAHGAALLSGRIGTPLDLLAAEPAAAAADPADAPASLAAWADVLLAADPARLPALFPAAVPHPDFAGELPLLRIYGRYLHPAEAAANARAVLCGTRA